MARWELGGGVECHPAPEMARTVSRVARTVPLAPENKERLVSDLGGGGLMFSGLGRLCLRVARDGTTDYGADSSWRDAIVDSNDCICPWSRFSWLMRFLPILEAIVQEQEKKSNQEPIYLRSSPGGLSICLSVCLSVCLSEYVVSGYVASWSPYYGSIDTYLRLSGCHRYPTVR